MIRKDKDQKRISYDEVAKNLNQGLEAADPLRLAGLTRLQRVRAIKGVSLQREQARLTQKLGGDHPRVKALSQKLEINRALERDVALGVSRARTATVQPDPDAWTLHGHVRNGAREGLPNMTVALYDDRNRWIEELGHACTDANGYFRLTVKPEGTIKRAADVEQAQATAAGEKAEPEAATIAARDASGTTVRRAAHIHVTDSQGTTRYIDADPLVPTLGEVVYREIILDGDGCECAPPGGKQPGTGRGGKEKEPDKTGRYLGNKNNHELHDMNNVKPRCQINEIKADHREFFTSQKQAIAAGYDLCAYCFGQKKSKR